MTVDDVIITPELWRRPKRPSDFEAEVRALESLAAAMSESPADVFQDLVDVALDLCRAGSAGISVWEQGDSSDVFRWRATAGEYLPYVGETLPRGFSPCGTVLDRNACLLMAYPARYFPYIEKLSSPVCEVLLVPFCDGATPIGTVWVVAHDQDRKFDAEDARVVTSLTEFAATAVSIFNRVEKAEKAEDELREVRGRIESTLIAGEVGTWVYEIEPNRVYVDRNLARMFGISMKEAGGGPLESDVRAIHPDDRPRVTDTISKAVESGSTFDAEYRLVDTAGRISWSRRATVGRKKSRPFYEAALMVYIRGGDASNAG